MPTLKDIARECGCDMSTVSRALQDSPRVKEVTKEKVRKAAEKLGYKPNVVARALARGKSQVVALLVPSLESASEHLPAKFISQYLLDYDYDLNICQYHESKELIKRQLNRIEQGSADAVIIIGSEISMSTFDDLLPGVKIPYLFLDRHSPGLKSPTITSANLRASLTLSEKVLADVDGIVHFFTRENSVTKKRLEGLMENIGSLPCTDFKQDLDSFCRDNKIKKLGILASVQESVAKFLEMNNETVKDLELHVGVYDHWHGSTEGFESVYVAIQDWKQVSAKAVESVMALINRRSLSSEFEEVPFLEILTLK